VRFSRIIAVVAVLALVTIACDPGEEVELEGEGPEAGQAEPGEAPPGTLIVAIRAQPDQLDPHLTTAHASFQVLENVYDTLVVPGADLEMEPSLAEDWETSDDGLTWTFMLRDDVTFHDGSQLTADDVVYSFERIMDEGANAFRFETVESVEATGEHTVEFNLTEPSPNLLVNVGAFKGMAIIKEGDDEELDLDNQANGTGPFRLSAIGPADVTLEAYDDHWGDGPHVDGVQFRFIAEPVTAMTEIQAGDVHLTDNVPFHQIEDLEAGDAVEVGRVLSTDFWYLAVNFEREPFDQLAVRQALAYAVDRETIAQGARFDAAEPNQTAIPGHSAWHHDHAPFTHDPERARQLLADAGAADLELGLMVTDEYPEGVQAAQVIAANLEAVGIDVDVQVEEFATWLFRQGEGDYDAFMLSWVGNIDPFDYYHAQHTCEGLNNFHGYCSEQVDELLMEAAEETDEEARKDLYDEAAELIVDEVSYLFFYNPETVYAWVPEVQGFDARPDAALVLTDVRIDG
jgi:peptide/nickel transport system substrate-binding protein